jgi:hypothetical protein
MSGEDDKKTAAILDDILAHVTRKPDQPSVRTIEEMFDRLIAESNRFNEGSIAMSGNLSLYVEVRAGVDKLMFVVANGNRGEPIFTINIGKPLRMGRYRLGLFLFPESN